MSAVALRGVTKAFGSAAPILNQVTLDVAAGELLALLGPSGSGKSTLLRCLAGLEQPTSGDVVIGDEVVTHRAPAARHVAMVFQRQALYPHLTVRGNLGFPLEVAGLPHAQMARRVLTMADRLGLDRLLDRRPGTLSVGERQRVALGRALIREPRVLLLDEPLAHLDGESRAELAHEIARWQAELGVTTVHVTQDLTEAFTLARRIAVLEGGRIHQTGAPREIYEAPADVQVARLLGRPGMNVLAGTARHEKRTTEVECGPLRVPVPLREYDGRIQIGIRPEHVSIVPQGAGVGDAVVRLTEPSGADTLVHLDAGGLRVTARIPGLPPIAAGVIVGLGFDPAQIHCFDSSGIRLG